MTLIGADDLNRRLEALRDGTASRQLLGDFGLLGVRFAKDVVPQKTRKLRQTIRVASIDERRQSVRIVAGGSRQIGYAAYVEFGTGLYGPRHKLIVPKRGKYLRFPAASTRRLSGSARSGTNKFIYARSVKGSRPQPYLVPGARKALREVGKSKAIIETWNKAA